MCINVYYLLFSYSFKVNIYSFLNKYTFCFFFYSNHVPGPFLVISRFCNLESIFCIWVPLKWKLTFILHLVFFDDWQNHFHFRSYHLHLHLHHHLHLHLPHHLPHHLHLHLHHHLRLRMIENFLQWKFPSIFETDCVNWYVKWFSPIALISPPSRSL